MKRPSQRFIHKRSSARSDGGSGRVKVDRNLRPRCAKSFLDVVPRPFREGTLYLKAKRSVRRSSSLVLFHPSRILLRFRSRSCVDILSPSSYPATAFSSFFVSRRTNSHRFFFDSDSGWGGGEGCRYAGKGMADSKRKVSFFPRESTFLPLLPFFFFLFPRAVRKYDAIGAAWFV